MSIKIYSAVLETMLPLTSEISVLKIGGKTIADWHRERASALNPGAELELVAEFWPSAELWRRFAESSRSFEVRVAGKMVARLLVRGGGEPEVVEPDPESRMITYPWDLLKLNEELVGAMTENRIEGTIRPGVTIDGVVALGEGSVMLPGVYVEGNAVFGKNCKIGPNCYIRGNTSVGDNCHIGQAVEIKNSVLQDKVSVGHLSYVGDSVVGSRVNFGAGTVTSNLRHDGQNHRWRIGDRLIETGRRKFGAVIGENVHTGIHTAIFPGRRIPANSETRPGQVIEK